MAIRDIVLRGFGNGTFSGSIALIVTRGYSIGEEVAAVTGGYTPYSVYDPGQEKRVRAKRKTLRRERRKLRSELRALLRGEKTPQEAPQAPVEVELAEIPVVVPDEPQRPQVDVAAIFARQARLEIIANEIAALSADLEALQAVLDRDLRYVPEDQLLTILLLAS